MSGRAAEVSPRPDVVMVYGFWGQNIGNAFFNVGGEWALRQAFGPDRVGRIQDQPGYRTFHRQSTGNPANALDLVASVEASVLVLQGPMLTETFQALWGPTFAALRAKGTRILLLGAALFRFSADEVASARRFLRDTGVWAMSTRDHDTYEALGGEVEHAHDGIDSAFFVPDAVRPPALDLGPYYCFAFDRYPEPTIGAGRGRGSRSFEHDGRTWTLREPKLAGHLARRGKAQAYIGHLLDRRSLPESLDGRRIVRPEHRTNPHVTWKVYRHPGAVASDEPYTYFALYEQADLTLSDRVHACVATLAYGRPAMLFSPTPRARLFDRLGVGDVRQRPVVLDREVLAAAKADELAFLEGLSTEVRSPA